MYNYLTHFSFSKFYPKTLEIALTNDDKAMNAEHITNIQCSQLFKGFTSEKVKCNFLKLFIYLYGIYRHMVCT